MCIYHNKLLGSTLVADTDKMVTRHSVTKLSLA